MAGKQKSETGESMGKAGTNEKKKKTRPEACTECIVASVQVRLRDGA